MSDQLKLTQDTTTTLVDSSATLRNTETEFATMDHTIRVRPLLFPRYAIVDELIIAEWGETPVEVFATRVHGQDADRVGACHVLLGRVLHSEKTRAIRFQPLLTRLRWCLMSRFL